MSLAALNVHHIAVAGFLLWPFMAAGIGLALVLWFNVKRRHGTHYHACRRCDRIWSHDPDTFTTAEEARYAHRCPDCGKPEYMAVRTKEEACELVRMNAP